VTKPDVVALLQTALALHQMGQVHQAERIYRDVIAIDANNANALNLLGLIVQDRGDLGEAERFFKAASAHSPQAPSFHFNLATVLTLKKDLSGALDAYARAIACDPSFAEAYLNRGVLYYAQQYFDDALKDFQKATTLAPQDARGYFNQGRSEVELSKSVRAEASLRRAIQLQPGYSEASLALADVLVGMSRVSEAIVVLRDQLKFKSDAACFSALGNLLRKSGDWDAALAAHRSAVAMNADDVLILHNYGATLFEAARFVEAEAVFYRAITRDPSFTKSYEGLAKTQEFLGLPDKAIETLRQALHRNPTSSDMRLKLAYRCLARGSFGEGWEYYESRFSTSDKRQTPRATPPPFWKGEDLRDKCILIWTEQGPGDEILYASIIPDVIARASHCIIECSPRLEPVFSRSFPRATVRSSGGSYAPAGTHRSIDYQTPAASLGQYFRCEFARFPNRQAFLRADPVRVASLRARYKALQPGNLLVGIAWRSANSEIGVAKSTELTDWADVLRVPRVTFINFQYGDSSEDLAEVRKTVGIQVFQDPKIDPLEDLEGFFAQVGAMDLVISTSNTTIHAAGSLGVPVWLLLSGSPGGLWYWFGEGNNSPWYPSLRCIRQDAHVTDSFNKFSFSAALSIAREDLNKCAISAAARLS